MNKSEKTLKEDDTNLEDMENQEIEKDKGNSPPAKDFDYFELLANGQSGDSSDSFLSSEDEEYEDVIKNKEESELNQLNINSPNPFDNILYRHEYKGIVIYDSSARIVGKNSKKNESSNFSPMEPVGEEISFSAENSPNQNSEEEGNNSSGSDDLTQRIPTKKDFLTNYGNLFQYHSSTQDQILYENLPKFSRSKPVAYEYSLVVPTFDEGLEFDSKFEGGNLKKAIRINKNKYNLLIEEDYNTKGHTQWFYFKVKSNLPAGSKVHFAILNFIKPQSLYSLGMRPFVFSEKEAAETNCGWVNEGEDINYYQNDIIRKQIRRTTQKKPHHSPLHPLSQQNPKFTQNSESTQQHQNGPHSQTQPSHHPHPHAHTQDSSKTYTLYYHTLEFSYTFKHKDDTVSLSQFIPFTYSDELELLKELKNCWRYKPFLSTHTLCRTLAGNKCPLLIISDAVEDVLHPPLLNLCMDKSSGARRVIGSRVERLRKRLLLKRNNLVRNRRYRHNKRKREKDKERDKEKEGKERDRSNDSLYEQSEVADINLPQIYSVLEPEYQNDHPLEVALLRHQEENKNKKAIIITARVHPGEVPSSWIMKGLLTYLLSDTQEAKLLRSHFIFYIIPMLNPDGVKYGNYRCSLLGVDLNRKWIAPNRFLQPTIFYAKQLVRMISEEREILMYCDLHGHSRKQNVFMYGCSHKNTQYEHIRKNANIRLIPLLLSQKNPNFSYRDSKFKLEKCKESTARIVLFKEFNISNSYTCEATFFGQEAEGRHMTGKEYEEMGEDLCKTICNFLPLRHYRNRAQIILQKVISYLHDDYLKTTPIPNNENSKVGELPQLSEKTNSESQGTNTISTTISTSNTAQNSSISQQSGNNINSSFQGAANINSLSINSNAGIGTNTNTAIDCDIANKSFSQKGTQGLKINIAAAQAQSCIEEKPYLNKTPIGRNNRVKMKSYRRATTSANLRTPLGLKFKKHIEDPSPFQKVQHSQNSIINTNSQSKSLINNIDDPEFQDKDQKFEENLDLDFFDNVLKEEKERKTTEIQANKTDDEEKSEDDDDISSTDSDENLRIILVQKFQQKKKKSLNLKSKKNAKKIRPSNAEIKKKEAVNLNKNLHRKIHNCSMHNSTTNQPKQRPTLKKENTQNDSQQFEPAHIPKSPHRSTSSNRNQSQLKKEEAAKIASPRSFYKDKLITQLKSSIPQQSLEKGENPLRIRRLHTLNQCHNSKDPNIMNLSHPDSHQHWNPPNTCTHNGETLNFPTIYGNSISPALPQNPANSANQIPLIDISPINKLAQHQHTLLPQFTQFSNLNQNIFPTPNHLAMIHNKIHPSSYSNSHKHPVASSNSLVSASACAPSNTNNVKSSFNQNSNGRTPCVNRRDISERTGRKKIENSTSLKALLLANNDSSLIQNSPPPPPNNPTEPTQYYFEHNELFQSGNGKFYYARSKGRVQSTTRQEQFHSSDQMKNGWILKSAEKKATFLNGFSKLSIVGKNSKVLNHAISSRQQRLQNSDEKKTCSHFQTDSDYQNLESNSPCLKEKCNIVKQNENENKLSKEIYFSFCGRDEKCKASRNSKYKIHKVPKYKNSSVSAVPQSQGTFEDNVHNMSIDSADGERMKQRRESKSNSNIDGYVAYSVFNAINNVNIPHPSSLHKSIQQPLTYSQIKQRMLGM